MTQISVRRPRPSERAWMEENMVIDSVRDEYFNHLMRMLLTEMQTVELIDDIWVSGRESRKMYALLTIEQQNAIQSLTTKTARIWINGVLGLDYDDDGIVL